MLALMLTAALQAPPPVPPGPRPAQGLKEVVRTRLGPAEAGTPEALAGSLYAFLSGPKDQKRDIERIRALFHPSARLIWSGNHPKEGAFFRMIELEAFLAFAMPQWEQGFFEDGTAVAVQRWEGMAQVWTPYTIRKAKEGPVAFKGVNALQCAWDGQRWWITHLTFQNQPVAAP